MLRVIKFGKRCIPAAAEMFVWRKSTCSTSGIEGKSSKLSKWFFLKNRRVKKMKIELKNSPGVKRAALWKSQAAAKRVERLDAVAIEADDCGIFESENMFQSRNSGMRRKHNCEASRAPHQEVQGRSRV